MKKSHGSSARGERAGKTEKSMKPKKIDFSDIPELSDKQLSRWRRRLSEIGDALEKISRGDASCH